ncbi:uncharacterized protein [Solanum tuberosum]|uniref:Wound-responsive family protein n=1 Tax=Solanum tuberosum TaxID=4113 RepID=M1BN34_SOLTU|nr:PREDICTED: uncharacterized protein LOC102594666 [Solanum tuberosum]KAH0706691.1 hypothetical protein KY289_011767 [Solanum tuberosum]KAH0735489.1 hypothetical protein KY285_011196 [Solanum tuberosum]
MSSSRRAWIVASSIGAVEALKDEGFARWNYTMRLLQQHAKANYLTRQSLSGKSSTIIVSNKMIMMKDKKLKQSEESLRNVMYLSCWGPN